MAQPRKLSPSELSQMMSGMSPQRATRFYNKCMTNPDTPQENINLLRQFRDQNPQMFLSEDQMKGDRGYKGSWVFGKGFSGGFREKPWGGVRDSDGFSYDAHGNRYDNYGNLDTGFTDGGSERFQGNGRANGFSNYYGAAYQKPRRPRRKPIGEVRSYEELGQTLMSLDSDVARTKYFNKVIQNMESNPETMANILRFRDNNPQIFASDEEAKAAGPVKKPAKGFWSNFWKSQDEFDAMAPKKKKFFVKAYQGRNHARNTAYGLRVMTNPETSNEDKEAMAAVVNENPGLFFKGSGKDRGSGDRGY